MKKQTIVTTKNGKLEGDYRNGVYGFKGVPYAAPPVGKLRWAPPQPVKPWDGVRPALEYGAISPQNLMAAPSDSPGVPNFGDQPQDEDCLFLNVWTPGLDDARRPVLFWIHGGAFIIGSGSEGFLDSRNLVKRGNIVLVSINYRLGALGFMNLKEITGGRVPATGNEGLLDQVAAIEWVHENIDAFGGDPDNITISGFSAGGMSVGTLLALPAARGKFHKAVNRSGAANIVSTLDSAVTISRQYLDVLGVKHNDIDALFDLTVPQLMEGQQVLGNKLREAQHRATPFQPVVDGADLPDMPMSLIRKGSAKKVPVIAGTSLDELKSMNAMDPALRNIDEAGIIARLNTLAPPHLVPGLVEAYRNALPARGVVATPLEILGSINTDLMFRIPTIRMLEAQRENGAAVYNYIFTYKCPAMGGVLGAMHGLDNPFLFGALDPQFTGDNPETQALSLRIQDSCAAFMHTGDPSCESAGPWPVYGHERATMLFDLKTRVEKAPYEAERRAWDSYAEDSTTPI